MGQSGFGALFIKSAQAQVHSGFKQGISIITQGSIMNPYDILTSPTSPTFPTFPTYPTD